MKSILLSSAAVFALAGAAAAEVTFSGSADLGYNDDALGDNDGFYSDLDITATLSQELDNGVSVGASINLDDFGNGTDSGLEYELFVTSANAGLFYGDTAFAAETHWVSAGDMEADGFSEADGEVALRGDITFGGVSASVSYALTDADDNDTVDDDVTQLSVGVAGDVGTVNFALGYQEESTDTTDFNAANGDFNNDEILGVSVGTSFAGADVRLAYADNSTSGIDSTGISVSYPVGPVTVGAYYVSESAGGDNWGLNVDYENGPITVGLDYDDDQGVEKIGLEGTYDVGNGLMVMAGYLTEDATADRFYVAGTYDLGSGASLLVSYADDDDDVDEDEIGAGEYQRGTTVEVSFEF